MKITHKIYPNIYIQSQFIHKKLQAACRVNNSAYKTYISKKLKDACRNDIDYNAFFIHSKKLKAACRDNNSTYKTYIRQKLKIFKTAYRGTTSYKYITNQKLKEAFISNKKLKAVCYNNNNSAYKTFTNQKLKEACRNNNYIKTFNSMFLHYRKLLHHAHRHPEVPLASETKFIGRHHISINQSSRKEPRRRETKRNNMSHNDRNKLYINMSHKLACLPYNRPAGRYLTPAHVYIHKAHKAYNTHLYYLVQYIKKYTKYITNVSQCLERQIAYSLYETL